MENTGKNSWRQALGNLYEYFLKRNGKRLTVLGATSGDTGGAAIYGMRGKENVDCFILFPEGRARVPAFISCLQTAFPVVFS